MGKAVSAADANRNFSHLLREAREGRTSIITSHGKPVAMLVPFNAERQVRAAARARLFKRLRTQPTTRPIGRWTRDELYENDR